LPAEVVVDRQKNRVMVQGPESAHLIAQTVQRELDRPARPAGRELVQGDRATLKAYSVGQNLESVEKELRNEYRGRADVQIATDPPSGKLFVHATAQIHEKIAARLATIAADQGLPSAQPGQLAAPQKRLPEPRGDLSRAETQLKHVTWQQMLSAIQGMTTKRLALQQAENGSDLTVDIPSKLGNATIHINPQNGVVAIEGAPGTPDKWLRAIRALDQPSRSAGLSDARIIPLGDDKVKSVSRAVALMQAAMRHADSAGQPQQGGGDVLRLTDATGAAVRRNLLAQQTPAADQPQPAANDQPPPDQPPADQPPADQPPAEAQPPVDTEAGLIGPVQVDFVEGLGAIIVRGRPQDVERVMRLIEELEKIPEPEVELVMLKHVDSQAIADLITQLNAEPLAGRQGTIIVTALIKPNALLLVGRAEAVQSTIDLINKLDQPVEPETQFQIFRLQHMPSNSAQATLETFFQERGGLGPRVLVQSDFRTNSLIVHASPRDMAEVAYLLQRIDVAESATVAEVQIFKLRNALASELASLLTQTLRGETGQAAQADQVQERPGAPPAQAAIDTTAAPAASGKSTMLQFKTFDAAERRILESGILTDVRVSSDTRTNSLVVTAPKESMELIAALIQQLDQLPTAEAQIDVFEIENGDALSLAQMLQTLFGQAQTPEQLQPGLQTAAGPGESSLVPLRFAVDPRSNSIIVTGSSSDLAVVDTVLTRLDEKSVSERRSRIYRLLNAPAVDVATAINEYLTTERSVVEALSLAALGPYELITREVVVVPEMVSNSLIISATPRYFDEIARLVAELDERPPMVMIQVLIAEVALDNQEELGVELGIQDSLLFDRSVAVGNELIPGFDFNNLPLGNSNSPASLATREKTAGQALSDFAVGRTNSDLGYGGLVLSASSESISVLVRALQESGRMDILSRPQIMTMNNQSASVLVGSLVPLITAVSLSDFGQTNAVEQQEVGLSLGVTPRISPDGLVVMEIDATKSSLGPVEEGIPVSINANGDVIRQPVINTTQASTTVSAQSGQTIILGGLITKDRSVRSRRIPYLSDVPVLGMLFRFDSELESRTELLFIMTPYIVNSNEDVEWLNQMESRRMSWCLADVVDVHGNVNMASRCEPWGIGTSVVYPDHAPFAPELGAPIILEDAPAVVPDAVTPEAPLPKLEPSASEDSPPKARQVGIATWDSVREYQTPGNAPHKSDEDDKDTRLEPPELNDKSAANRTKSSKGFWSKLRAWRSDSKTKADVFDEVSPVQFVRPAEPSSPPESAGRGGWPINTGQWRTCRGQRWCQRC
jgi:type II secretion system protein D